MEEPKQKNSKKSAVRPSLPMSIGEQGQTSENLEPNTVVAKERTSNIGPGLVPTANDVLTKKENDSSGYNSDDSEESLVF